MAIGTDILIDYTNKRIYQAAPASAPTYTAQELYTYLMGVFDDQAQMDNAIPMSAQTPNAFTMTNGWFIDDETVKWFKGGAITTESWTHPTNPTGIRLLKLDAAANLTVADIGKAVLGGVTGDTGKLLAYDVTRKVLWVRCDAADDLFDNATEAITVDAVACGNMTVVSTTGENLYVNVYTLGTLTSGSDTIYVIQNDEKLTAWWSTGITAFDVLIKVKELGAVIDSGNIIVFCRYYPSAGNAALYDHFPITLTAGRQAVPLATALDLNNTSSQAVASGYASAMTFGFAGPYSRTLGGVTKDYDIEIDLNTDTVAHLYEACKYVCREGSTTQLQSDNGEEYIYANAAYAPVKASPLGTFAGGTFFGARGVWITDYASADAQKFSLISSDNTTVNPPNTVVCKVVAVESGDSVAMFMLASSGGAIEKTTYSLNGQHLSSSTTVTVNEAITANWSGQDPPAAGYLRIVSSVDGSEILKKYTSWTGYVFTLDGTLGTQAETTWKVYVPIIDGAATSTTIQNSLVKAVASNVYIRTVVRHYAAPPNGIVPWSQDTSIPYAGVTVNATRTTDGIAL
uniref:Putative structural protein n=1 Tax=viral metagenome TaxID=1070528 RepID=A0A6H1ZZ72_9ZZZZ